MTSMVFITLHSWITKVWTGSFCITGWAKCCNWAGNGGNCVGECPPTLHASRRPSLLGGCCRAIARKEPNWASPFKSRWQGRLPSGIVPTDRYIRRYRLIHPPLLWDWMAMLKKNEDYVSECGCFTVVTFDLHRHSIPQSQFLRRYPTTMLADILWFHVHYLLTEHQRR